MDPAGAEEHAIATPTVVVSCAMMLKFAPPVQVTPEDDDPESVMRYPVAAGMAPTRKSTARALTVCVPLVKTVERPFGPVMAQATCSIDSPPGMVRSRSMDPVIFGLTVPPEPGCAPDVDATVSGPSADPEQPTAMAAIAIAARILRVFTGQVLPDPDALGRARIPRQVARSRARRPCRRAP